MKSAYELLRENFERWEVRGRGVLTFSEPVNPKPPFAPFPGHRLSQLSTGEDSVRHTRLSGFLQRVKSLVRGDKNIPLAGETATEVEVEPNGCGEEVDWIEMVVRAPPSLNPSRESMVAMLAGLSMTRDPLAFEIVGTGQGSFCQWAASSSDARALEKQMQAHFPEVKLSPRQGRLREAWEGCAGDELAV
ncbi:MAG: hypothetical protein JNG86_14520, partial [Verrucomicrobiaceae bacterium]|nr:hypothetical protein [Verrucomicrobiaceae bacterium]